MKIKVCKKLKRYKQSGMIGLFIFFGSGCQVQVEPRDTVGVSLVANVVSEPVQTIDQPTEETSIYPIEETLVYSVEEISEYLVLVNQAYALDPSFSPHDLRLLNVMDFRNNPNTVIYLRNTAALAVEEMFQTAMDEEGMLLLARSGYRSYQTQTQVHENFVNLHGREAAERFSARPGHSEHQTGLALDVTANSVHGELVQWFSQTSEGFWLKHNAHRFGFIISYPEGREEDTGFIYEPWHIRYVGIEAATTIYTNNWILEEYLAYLNG